MKANCLHCQKEFGYVHYHKRGKYCSNECNGIHKSKLHKEKWYLGQLKTIERVTIRRYLAEDRGYKCELCGQGELWNSKKLTLHVDHIDGNAGDNTPNNVRLLCPNCHSQTEFLGGANKGRGRKARGLPLR